MQRCAFTELIYKDMLRRSKHTCQCLRDAQMGLERGLIRRELPRLVIIRLQDKRVNGRELG